MKPNCCANCCDPKPAAVALGRWCLGVVLLFFGIGKLPEIGGFVHGYLVEQFQGTWLPAWMIIPFGYVLPFVEIVLGLLLIVGLWRSPVLFAAGVLFLMLTFGAVVLGEAQKVSANTIYVFLAAALLFLEEHDRWIPWRSNGQATSSESP